MFLAAGDYRRSGGSATAAIQFQEGPHKDPAWFLRMNCILMFLEIWRDSSTRRPLLRHAWGQLVRRLGPLKWRWTRVRGPMAAAVATLMDIGWRPTRPDLWTSPEGDTFALDLDDPSIKIVVQREVGQRLQKWIWAHTEGEFLKRGTEQGVDWTVWRRTRKRLRKRPLLEGVASAVVQGALWPESRKHSAGLCASSLFARCGKAEGAMLHHFWA